MIGGWKWLRRRTETSPRGSHVCSAGEQLRALDGLGPTSGRRRRPGLTDEVYEPHWLH